MTLIKYGKVMKKAKTMNRYNHVAHLTGYTIICKSVKNTKETPHTREPRNQSFPNR